MLRRVCVTMSDLRYVRRSIQLSGGHTTAQLIHLGQQQLKTQLGGFLAVPHEEAAKCVVMLAVESAIEICLPGSI